MPAIETGNAVFYEAPGASVGKAASLLDAFAPVPYLRLESLRIAVAPEIDEARFRYRYGPLFREDGGVAGVEIPWEAFAEGCRCDRDTLRAIAGELALERVERGKWSGMVPLVHPLVVGAAAA